MTAASHDTGPDDDTPTILFPASHTDADDTTIDPRPLVVDSHLADAGDTAHDVLLREHGRAVILAQHTRNGYRLDQLKASWLSTLDSPASQEAYLRDLHKYLDYCLDHDLDPLTLGIPEFNLYVTWLKVQTTRYGKPYSPATIVRKIDVVASFYNHLVDTDAVDRSPVRKKGRPRHKRRRVDKALTLVEADAVIQDSKTGHRTLGALCAELIVELDFTMGIRVSEICNLDLDQLSWVEENGRRYRGINFVGKGGDEHVRGIPAQLDERLLTPYLAQRPEPASLEHASALLLTLNGKRINRFQVNRLLERAHRRGVTTKKVTPHWGRHTFNRTAEEADFSLQERQRALGHSSAMTTQGYGDARNSIVGDPSHEIARRLYAARNHDTRDHTGANPTLPTEDGT